MGTKVNPGKFDCFSKALPDEPMFILLARDPDFAMLVGEWASRREAAISFGRRPESDRELVKEARQCAADGERWRRENMNVWRAEPVDAVHS